MIQLSPSNEIIAATKDRLEKRWCGISGTAESCE
jgi:hypothetical protein